MPSKEALPGDHPLVTQRIPQLYDLEQAYERIERGDKDSKVVEGIRTTVREMEEIHAKVEEGAAAFQKRYGRTATIMSLEIRTALTDKRLAALGIRSPLAFKWPGEGEPVAGA